jgi:hypothetical protein
MTLLLISYLFILYSHFVSINFLLMVCFQIYPPRKYAYTFAYLSLIGTMFIVYLILNKMKGLKKEN